MTAPRAILRIRFADAIQAQRVSQALAADDDAFVATHQDGDTVIIEATGRDLRSLLRSLDDVLATTAVSEDLIKSPGLAE